MYPILQLTPETPSQAVFDAAIKHMLRQRVEGAAPGTEACLYRAEGCLACAVGAFMTDDEAAAADICGNKAALEERFGAEHFVFMEGSSEPTDAEWEAFEAALEAGRIGIYDGDETGVENAINLLMGLSSRGLIPASPIATWAEVNGDELLSDLQLFHDTYVKNGGLNEWKVGADQVLVDLASKRDLHLAEETIAAVRSMTKNNAKEAPGA